MQLLPYILNMSLTGSYVILAVLLARLLFRKAPKIFSYLLWLPVLFRLLCPVSFTLPISLFRGTGLPVTSSGALQPIPANLMSQQGSSLYLPLTGELSLSGAPRQVAALQAVLLGGTVLWAVGAAAMVLYSGISLLRLRHRLVGAMRLEGNIFLADHLDSPFVMGIFRPKIYLPSTLSKKERQYVLLHEQCHLHRGDHIVKAVSFLALTIHWFNPLAWLAFFLSGKDMEMSCDEMVIRRLGSGICADYSASLLSLSVDRRTIAVTPLAFGEGEVKGRIRNLLGYKKAAMWVTLTGLLGVSLLCLSMMANPSHFSGEVLRDFTVTESSFTLPYGQSATLRLVITEGNYLEGNDVALGGGWGEQNYAGTCVLQVWSGSSMLSEYSLQEFYGESQPMVFNSTGFPIYFSDYNEDGLPDFAIGRWGSSSINLFSLFTVDESGQISPTTPPDAIPSSEGKWEQGYSILFATENGNIKTEYYDNTTGGMMIFFYF